jgi:hypothetical protein
MVKAAPTVWVLSSSISINRINSLTGCDSGTGGFPANGGVYACAERVSTDLGPLETKMDVAENNITMDTNRTIFINRPLIQQLSFAPLSVQKSKSITIIIITPPPSKKISTIRIF